MGRGRKFTRKPLTRPKKNLGDKRRREKVQRRRLIALGVPESQVNAMNPKQVRELLKKPLRTKKWAAKMFVSAPSSEPGKAEGRGV